MFLKTFAAAFLLFQFTISVDVDLVVFNVTVLGDGGRPVKDLTAENFHIYEDGREQEIKIFQPEDTPATVGLLIDNSGSMRNKTGDVVNAAWAFIQASHPEDEMFIVNFNRTAWLALPESKPFTSDHTELRVTLSGTNAQGTTALYDAVVLALNHLKKGTRQRKALVVLSDGGDNSSVTKLDDALRMAEQSSATIYCIGIYDAYEKEKNPAVLKRFARATGGEAYFPNTLRDLQDVWPKIAGAIRGQYTIGYMSTNGAQDGSYRKVKITASTKRGKVLDVRSRPGYVSSLAK